MSVQVIGSKRTESRGTGLPIGAGCDGSLSSGSYSKKSSQPAMYANTMKSKPKSSPRNSSIGSAILPALEYGRI